MKVNPVIAEDARLMAERLGAATKVLEGSNILITGAAGFLCSYLIDVLAEFNRNGTLARPVKITALDNFLRGVPERLAHLASDRNVTTVTHDATRPYEAKPNPDWIVHGASIASPIFYRKFPLETIDVNVNGTWQMLKLAREGTRSMVFLSSSEIYGDPDPSFIPTPESYRGYVSCTGPRACYDESKRLGETLCSTFHAQFGTPVKVIRPFNVYGPGQSLDDQRIIPDLVRSALLRQPIVLFSDGRATRSFCYAADFIVGLLLVLLSDADGQAFNIGTDEEVSIADAAHAMAEVAGKPPLEVRFAKSGDPNYLTDNPQRRCPDLKKISGLGYKSAISLRTGLERTLRSYDGADIAAAAKR